MWQGKPLCSIQLLFTCLLMLWNHMSCQPPHLEEKAAGHQIMGPSKRSHLCWSCLPVLLFTFISISFAGQSTFFSSCKSVEISLASSICEFLTLVAPPIEEPLLNFLITRSRILLQVASTLNSRQKSLCSAMEDKRDTPVKKQPIFCTTPAQGGESEKTNHQLNLAASSQMPLQSASKEKSWTFLFVDKTIIVNAISSTDQNGWKLHWK